jgi:hypothetical protein
VAEGVLLVRRQVPEHDRAVNPNRAQHHAIRSKRDRLDRASVSDQGLPGLILVTLISLSEQVGRHGGNRRQERHFVPGYQSQMD